MWESTDPRWDSKSWNTIQYMLYDFPWDFLCFKELSVRGPECPYGQKKNISNNSDFILSSLKSSKIGLIEFRSS